MSEKNFNFKCSELVTGPEAFSVYHGKKIPLLIKSGGVKRVIGRKIIEVSPILGTYGMGGPGFFGFNLEKNKRYPEEWLVLTIWGADNWLLLDDKWLSNDFHKSNPKKCYFQTNETIYTYYQQQLGGVFNDLTISDFKLKKKSFKMIIKNDSRTHKLEFPNDLTKLSVYRNGQPRKWHWKEKMSDGLIISPTRYICI